MLLVEIADFEGACLARNVSIRGAAKLIRPILTTRVDCPWLKCEINESGTVK